MLIRERYPFSPFCSCTPEEPQCTGGGVGRRLCGGTNQHRQASKLTASQEQPGPESKRRTKLDRYSLCNRRLRILCATVDCAFAAGVSEKLQADHISFRYDRLVLQEVFQHGNYCVGGNLARQTMPRFHPPRVPGSQTPARGSQNSPDSYKATGEYSGYSAVGGSPP